MPTLPEPTPTLDVEKKAVLLIDHVPFEDWELMLETHHGTHSHTECTPEFYLTDDAEAFEEKLHDLQGWGYSETLLNLLRLARAQGFDWVEFDPCGQLVEGLPTFVPPEWLQKPKNP